MFFNKQETKKFFGIKVRLKSRSKLMKFINFFFKHINPNFMSTYWTTVLTTVYAPSCFDAYFNNEENELNKEHRITLEHEAIHIYDIKKYHIWFVLTYLLPPILFSYGRFYWERKAYLPELQNLVDEHQYVYFYKRLNKIADALSGPSYGWCWRKKYIMKWFLNKTMME